MKFDVDDKNRCRLVCVKCHLNRCRFAVAVAECLGGSLFWDTVYIEGYAFPSSGVNTRGHGGAEEEAEGAQGGTTPMEEGRTS